MSGRIILGEDDFEDPTSESPAQPAMNGAPTAGRPSLAPPTMPLPTVTRGVPRSIDPSASRPVPGGPPGAPSSVGTWLTSPSKAPLSAAAIGVLLAWVITEALGLADITYHSTTGLDAVTALWTGVVGLVFGGTLQSFDSAVAGAWSIAAERFARAAAPMFAVSFAAGWVADVVYRKLAKDALEQEIRSLSLTKNNAELYLARGLGWALFGVGIGVTIGLITRSNKRAVNGALGGALGGLAGGLVFEFVAVNLGVGASTSRLVGLAAIGALIALATRAIEAARREAWLQVIAGGMVGKEFILYHAITRLGASPDCEIFLLKDPAVQKHHAQIDEVGVQRTLRAMPGAGVLVNGTPIETHVLRNGDQVQIGNTVIAYSERALVGAVTGV